MKKALLTIAAVAAVLAVGTTGGAVAGSVITSAKIQDDTVRAVDLKNGYGVAIADVKPGLLRMINADSLAGAYYATAVYDDGDTNAGAIATVACKVETDVAIAGGVQVLGLDAGANSRNTPVSSSFPGRMDWTTNTPKPDRLDGWIVQFGGNAGPVSDVAPEKTTLYALCVPGIVTQVENTFTQ